MKMTYSNQELFQAFAEVWNTSENKTGLVLKNYDGDEGDLKTIPTNFRVAVDVDRNNFSVEETARRLFNDLNKAFKIMANGRETLYLTMPTELVASAIIFDAPFEKGEAKILTYYNINRDNSILRAWVVAKGFYE